MLNPDTKSKKSVLLSDVLDPEQILIYDEPIGKEEVIAKLVDLVCRKHSQLSASSILNLIKLREEKGSTFLNEGIALPHITLDGMDTPIVGLALTKAGISNVESERTIEAVFLLLDPASPEASQAKLMSKAMKAIRALHAQRELASVHTGEQLIDLVRRVEANRDKI